MDTDIFFYEYTPNAIQLILSLKDYDIIHFMWRGSVFILSEQESTPYLQQIGMTYDEFKKITWIKSALRHLYMIICFWKAEKNEI